MSDELAHRIEVDARLGAIEVLLTYMIALQYVNAGLSNEQIDKLMQLQTDSLHTSHSAKEGVPSDAANDMLLEHVQRLLEAVKSRVDAQRPKT